MCGIFVYKGKANPGLTDLLLNGLARLDYRGHDSAGIAFVGKDKIKTYKAVGDIANVEKLIIKKITGNAGISHTRWATHGKVTKVNAHPHVSSDGQFALVHNGIVENFERLKNNLKSGGYKFISQTDTEVIVALIESGLKKKRDYVKTIRDVAKKLDGRNTFVLITKNGDIYGFKNGSPLVLGEGKNKVEYYLSSDTLSFSDLTNIALTLENGEIIALRNDSYEIFSATSGTKIGKKPKPIDIDSGKIEKEGYPHFMLKEINESPYVIRQVALNNKSQIADLAEHIKKAGKVYTLGSGTAGVAAGQMAYYLREIAGIEATSLIGAEAKSYYKLFSRKDLILVPSQSGETADVLEVLEIAKEKGVKIASFVNMPGSSIEKLSDFYFASRSGPEVCVLSTKVFIAQIAWGYLLAKTVAGDYGSAVMNLQKLATEIGKMLNDDKNLSTIKNWAKLLIKSKDIFLLGKSQNLAIAREGMIKIIEGTYKHAHAIPAGDLKHYAITIIEKGVPVILITSDDENFGDTVNAANEVKARGATVFGIGQRSDNTFERFFETPNTAECAEIANIIPLQLLSYYMAVSLGNNIDKPRNIAKSVTVK